MLGEPTTFWGKLRRDATGAVVAWHPLVDHCIDVAACFQGLLSLEVPRRRLAATAGLLDLTPQQRSRLTVLAGLHDLGKLNLGFQNKALAGPARVAGHVKEVLALFTDCPEGRRLGEALEIETLEGWGDGALELLVAALSHHGRPAPVGVGRTPELWRAARGLDPFTGARELMAVLRAWLPEAFTAREAPLPDAPPFHHAFSGLVTLADWLGSDTTFFPYSSEADPDRRETAPSLAARVLERIGLDPVKARRSLGGRTPSFSAVFGNQPRPAQSAVAALPAEGGGSISLLEAETGAGKTEAAVMRYLTLFQAGEVDGMYFALPTRTAATQIFRRVNAAVAHAFPEPESRPPVVLAVPGYIAVDDAQGTRLPDFEVLWNDEPSDRWHERGWAAESSKRYLAGSVVVGTVDQVLLSALMVPHSHLRASALMRHLLVVDEVHASDAYMTGLMTAVLRRHRGAGGHALLMSATFEDHAAVCLLGGTERRTLDQSEARPFPLLTHVGADGHREVRVARSAASKEIRVETGLRMNQPAQIARAALSAAADGAKVLIIRNTVRGCLEVQQALEAIAPASPFLMALAGQPVPHHSRYAKPDRELLDALIERSLGRPRPAGGFVAVATQTVQQSLDLDADVLLTDLCPVDVLLQRAGRLFRHADSERAAGFDAPRMVVLVPEERDLGRYVRRGGAAPGPHGIGTVYEDLRILEATWRLLDGLPVWRIPEMNRLLVERGLHPEQLRAITAELGEPWPTHEAKVVGARMALCGQARTLLVDWSVRLSEPASLFPENVQIPTRLGTSDRMVRFDDPMPGPFGRLVPFLTVPGHLAADVPPDAGPEDVSVGSGSLSFRFGGRQYLYDRLGLRPVTT